MNGHRNTTRPAFLGSLAASVALLSAVAVQCMLSGCANWSREADVDRNGSILPPRQLSPDSVLIETVLVRFPQDSEAELAELWRLNNEAIFDMEFRQRLDKNGLRAGILLGELPKAIRQQLEATAIRQSTDALEHAGLAADVDNKMRKLQCRAGRRNDLLVKPELVDPLTVLTTRDGKHVSGGTFERASVLFDLRAVPHGNGSATIELTPEIQYGDERQAFITTDYGFRPGMRRGLQTWKELKMVARLNPGQVLMISSTLPAKALGNVFFVSTTADHSEEHVVLLLRLAETQLDELFAPEAIEQAHALSER